MRVRRVGADVVTATTQSEPLTGDVAILGMLQYMAPEQLEGHEADARAEFVRSTATAGADTARRAGCRYHEHDSVD